MERDTFTPLGRDSGLKATDKCLLCNVPMGRHSIVNEEFMVGTSKAIRPVGWKCPDMTKPASAEQNNDVIDVGKEAFASSDRRVIMWGADMFLRTCNEFVYDFPPDDPEGRARSFCIKRAEHPSLVHEDMDGRTRSDFVIDFDDCTLEEAVYQAIGAGSMCWANMSQTGVFQEDRARIIGEALMKRIREAGPIYG